MPDKTPAASAPSPARRKRGSLAHEAGLQAETLAADFLIQQGYTLLARRFRTPHGEIDLLMDNGDCLLAVEVKQRSTLADARYALSHRQGERLLRAFGFIIETRPDWQRPDNRLDVLIIDRAGSIEQIENALQLW